MGVERCLRYAFEYARERNRGRKVTLCGKTNVLTNVLDLWERVFHEIGERDYPDITRDYAHVDATVMWMVKNPEWFDVIVTENMFGDILLTWGNDPGGMGIAAGGASTLRGFQCLSHRWFRSQIYRPKCQSAGGHQRRRHDAETLGEKKVRSALKNRLNGLSKTPEKHGRRSNGLQY